MTILTSNETSLIAATRRIIINNDQYMVSQELKLEKKPLWQNWKQVQELYLLEQESRAVAGNPRDAAVIFDP